MSNQLEKPKSEENMCLESDTLPTKEVKKVDEQLTIEFTDIKQEPKYNSEHKQNFLPLKMEIKFRCISCDTYFANNGNSDAMATIHETCFQKLCAELYSANNKIQTLEVTNNSMIGNIKNT